MRHNSVWVKKQWSIFCCPAFTDNFIIFKNLETIMWVSAKAKRCKASGKLYHGNLSETESQGGFVIVEISPILCFCEMVFTHTRPFSSKDEPICSWVRQIHSSSFSEGNSLSPDTTKKTPNLICAFPSGNLCWWWETWQLGKVKRVLGKWRTETPVCIWGDFQCGFKNY